MKNKLLFTHKNCADGAGCVFTFINGGGNVGDVIYTDYKKPISEIVLTAAGLYNYSGIVIADVNVTEEDYLKIKSMYQGTVEIYDHHTGSIGWEVTGVDFKAATIDMCGCMLYWTNVLAELPTPELFKYIDDRDRWVFKYPETKYISTALYTNNFNLVYFSTDTLQSEQFAAVLAKEGLSISKLTEKQISDILRNTVNIDIAYGVTAIMCNSPLYHSEIGEALYNRYPDKVTGVFYITSDGKVNFSLRSKTGIGPDVETIAKLYDGGGHRHAAGFSIMFNNMHCRLDGDNRFYSIVGSHI